MSSGRKLSHKVFLKTPGLWPEWWGGVAKAVGSWPQERKTGANHEKEDLSERSGNKSLNLMGGYLDPQEEVERYPGMALSMAWFGTQSSPPKITDQIPILCFITQSQQVPPGTAKSELKFLKISPGLQRYLGWLSACLAIQRTWIQSAIPTWNI